MVRGDVDPVTHAIAFALSGFGESMVLLTTTLLGAVWFWLNRQGRVAAIWLAAIVGCAATMASVKLAFLTCGQLLLSGLIHTPSGHAAMASVFYGMVALVLRHSAWQTRPIGHYALAAAAGIALAVGLSRVALQAHNAGEVAIGLAVGGAWTLGGAVMLRRSGSIRLAARSPQLATLLLVYGGLLILAWSGTHVSAEGILAQLADLIHERTGLCRP